MTLSYPIIESPAAGFVLCVFGLPDELPVVVARLAGFFPPAGLTKPPLATAAVSGVAVTSGGVEEAAAADTVSAFD